jgi:glycosyltransferase involved in cell wall biosynthesis
VYGQGWPLSAGWWSTTLRIAILTELGSWSASTRFRALLHADRLAGRLGTVDLLLADDRPRRRAGRAGQVGYFAGHAVHYLRRWQELHAVLDRYDALLVQRGVYAVGPGLVAGPVERFGGRVVLDLDDDVFTLKPDLEDRNAAVRWLYGPQQAKRLLRRADAVVVSTDVLRLALARHGIRERPVTVLPTVLDPGPYEQADVRRNAGTVGWAGTNGGLRYLDPLRTVFARLAADRVAELEVVCSSPWSGPSVFRRWRIEDEHSLFGRFAVGIMPLPATPYTEAKAGLKLLQYMAAGVPVVASPVGINRHLVERSGAGFTAETPTEWETALRRLLADGDLRATLGARGREFVAGYVDLDGQADVIAGLLRADGGR